MLLWPLDSTNTYTVLVFTCFTFLVYVGTTILAVKDPLSPFQTPIATLVRRLGVMFRDASAWLVLRFRGVTPPKAPDSGLPGPPTQLTQVSMPTSMGGEVTSDAASIPQMMEDICVYLERASSLNFLQHDALDTAIDGFKKWGDSLSQSSDYPSDQNVGLYGRLGILQSGSDQVDRARGSSEPE